MKHGWSGGFSWVEGLIVLLILGALMTAAAARRTERPSRGEREAARRQLQVLRDAIAMYHGRYAEYPSAGGLPGALAPLLDGPFPAPGLGRNGDSRLVHDDPDNDPKTPAFPDVSSGRGWVYKSTNGSLQINCLP